jgi:hypothetical protein
MTKEFILHFLKTHKQELQLRFGVSKIGLFGSYVRQENNESSDIDIAVEFESDNRFRTFFMLKYYLEENLKAEVDLGVEHTLKSIIRESIQKEIIYV